MQILTVSQMRDLEAQADRLGCSYAIMMETAGRGVAKFVAENVANAQTSGVVGLVGSGNNGGDTLIALLELHQKGFQVSAYLVGEHAKNESLLNNLVKISIPVVDSKLDIDGLTLASLIKPHTIILDGIFGTGFHLPLKKDVANVLIRVKNLLHPSTIVAVDCPSGVECDSGEMAAETLPADFTICMQAVKTGLLKYPAFSSVGHLAVIDLDLPADALAAFPPKDIVLTQDKVRSWLPIRSANAHKGTFGSVLVLAGSRAYVGAPMLAARAAYMLGAGLVRMAVPRSIQDMLAPGVPEAVWNLLAENEQGQVTKDNLPILQELLKSCTAAVVGPGWGTASTTKDLLNSLLMLDTPKCPLVIDADGLRLLAEIPEWWMHLPPNTILTPHPGEMEALSHLPISEIQANRLDVVNEFAAKWQIVLVLKGALTAISDRGVRSATLARACPALAKAGTGDVLAGMIASLLAQRVPAYKAAGLAAWLHLDAGELASAGYPSRSVMASDVVNRIPSAIFNLE